MRRTTHLPLTFREMDKVWVKAVWEKSLIQRFRRIADLQQKFYEQMKDTFFVEGPDYITIPLADEGTQVFVCVLYRWQGGSC